MNKNHFSLKCLITRLIQSLVFFCNAATQLLCWDHNSAVFFYIPKELNQVLPQALFSSYISSLYAKKKKKKNERLLKYEVAYFIQFHAISHKMQTIMIVNNLCGGNVKSCVMAMWTFKACKQPSSAVTHLKLNQCLSNDINNKIHIELSICAHHSFQIEINMNNFCYLICCIWCTSSKLIR